MNQGAALYIHPGVKVRPCEWGYGVFTDAFIKAGDLIEECHYLKLPRALSQNPQLQDYVFLLQWAKHEVPREGEWVALVLGYGMIYNHAREPNTSYHREATRDVFCYHALRDIHPGEQLCISYGEDWWASRDQGVPA
ncbi:MULTISPECIES: SET domain-containing protein-lysine N-methyltransferase [Myxococcus]|uniref:SET domain-containing protein n=1 Tax=Myxococcus virescens TaxID=83456 RepID=A0A511HAW6_9BACT|nr:MULTISPECIES: SET domain-containing protein-lysine N-methyltransferase [Myxococcus]WNZ60442.1 SET domain-containing protein-lysine N-methyltransferase [Myxococcus sp. MxC21-1]GEL70696.1 hypothetical protein MVI01_24800 [Myxococcus virescens]SDE13194.1 hypothetical protein SAMN04488504_104353 [Myxococcus virescens]